MSYASTLTRRLTHFHAPALRQPAFKLIDANQSESTDTQLLALATALVAMSDGLGLNAHDVVTQVNKARAHIDGPFSGQFQAIVEYTKGELR